MLRELLLGIIEGLTEFIPVSSTGHLVVASKLLGMDQHRGTFEIVVQLGAVMAVIWHYRQELQDLISLKFGQTSILFWRNIVIAIGPIFVAGYLFSDLITTILFSYPVVSTALIAGGIVLILIDSGKTQQPSEPSLHSITARQAMMIGFVQLLALVPGVSRSGATIVGGLATGLSRPTATAFSFILSVPTLGGAVAYKIKSEWSILQSEVLLSLAVATLAAFITSLLVIPWLLRFVSKNNLRPFGWYRIAAGLMLFALWSSGVI